MNPIGFYVDCDSAECSDCHIPENWKGFEDWDEPIPIFTNTESDTPTHCGICKGLIRHNLTSDGYRYVEEAIEQEASNPVVEAWREAYSDCL